MTVTLEKELKSRNIRVIKVYPRQVATPFWHEKVPKGSVSPEEVADVILKAIKTKVKSGSLSISRDDRHLITFKFRADL